MFAHPEVFDVIVVGGGHAGCEAALAAARMGRSVLLLTINVDRIAHMSCNPAVGGLAKGHLVKEIDALGAEMAKNTDATGIQFRRLNTKKGMSVWSSRAQVDMEEYRIRMRQVLEQTPRLLIHQGRVSEVLVEDGQVVGVRTELQEVFRGRTVVLAPGTFLRGLIHIGLQNFPGGRLGDPPSEGLSRCLEDLGFRLGRFKTGTTPRLDGRSIDFERLRPQYGDDPPRPFSFSTERIDRPQVPCWITYTNERTHEIIRRGLDRSPLYTGVIKATGVRYCPSIEDKVVKFPDKPSHQIFLEPEGLRTLEYYPNGISTSLPIDLQVEMVRSIEGLESAEIVRPGYGIEHDYVDPTQLEPSLEAKAIEGLFLAGQINGTTGYEEAAAQGLIAGINAALKVQGEEPLVLDRSQAYIGVLIDDLVTKGTNEPYRMFTSRAEYRLLLREDNADLRLMPIGHRLGLIPDGQYRKLLKKKKAIEEALSRLEGVRLRPTRGVNDRLKAMGTAPLKTPVSLKELLRRPELEIQDLAVFDQELRRLPQAVAEEVSFRVKYEGYIRRQREQVEKFRRLEEVRIPEYFEYDGIPGLSNEIREKLSRIRPRTLGQASRVPGVTPAAIMILQVYLKRREAQET